MGTVWCYVIVEAQIGVVLLQAKDTKGLQPPKVGRGLPLTLQREYGSADIMASDFQLSDNKFLLF